VTLPTLKHSVPMLQQQVRTLTVENVNPRPRGRRWMRTRERIQVEQGSRCVDCGRLWIPERDHVDHDTPREQGGSDADANLRLRCIDCHEVKSRREASLRGQGER
jgi:5-methylcytosine-specific restriction protein A